MSGFYCSHPVLPNNGWVRPGAGLDTATPRRWAAYCLNGRMVVASLSGSPLGLVSRFTLRLWKGCRAVYSRSTEFPRTTHEAQDTRVNGYGTWMMSAVHQASFRIHFLASGRVDY